MCIAGRDPIIEKDDDDGDGNEEAPITTALPTDVEESLTTAESNIMRPNTTYYPPTPRRPGFRARVTQKGFDFG